MIFEQIIFYLFSAVLVTAAVGMVTVRNPVYAALCLILSLFTSAALWLLLEAEFLGIVLVLVYVGAVMGLFLFVIMMLDLNIDPLEEGFAKYMLYGPCHAIGMMEVEQPWMESVSKYDLKENMTFQVSV